VRGNVPQDGSEKVICETVSDNIGFEPMFVQGPSGQGMNLVMFIPVQ